MERVTGIEPACQLGRHVTCRVVLHPEIAYVRPGLPAGQVGVFPNTDCATLGLPEADLG